MKTHTYTAESIGKFVLSALGAVGLVIGVVTGVTQFVDGFVVWALVVIAILLIVAAFTTILIWRMKVESDRHLERTGNVALVVVVLVYAGAVVVLSLVTSVDPSPWSGIFFTWIGVFLVVECTVLIRAGALDQATQLSPVEVLLRLSVLALGTGILGVAAAAGGLGVAAWRSGHSSTAATLFVEAVAVGVLGLSVLIARRAVVCLFALAVGFVILGFGAASIVGGDVFFGGAVAGVGISSLLVSMTLWQERPAPAAAALLVASVSAVLVGVAATSIPGGQIFAFAFLVLCACLLLTAFVFLFNRDRRAFFRHPDTFRPWSLWRYVALSVIGFVLLLVSGWFAVDALQQDHPGVFVALLGTTLAALTLLLTPTIAAFRERTNRLTRQSAIT